MNILHFSLGLPPYRSGGLTKYATDLMVSQHTSGLNVSLLYPGDFTFWKIPKMYIDKPKDFLGVQTFEIKNPPSVPLLHGVSDPADIYNASSLDNKALVEFYENVKPDVFHVHTLMGLPLSLLTYLKEKGVKLVFTTHDYYGLCPKVNFINQDNALCAGAEPQLCAICNKNAKSTLYLKLRNSKYLLRHKKMLGSKVNKGAERKMENDTDIDLKTVNEYSRLLHYYTEIFNKFDVFHFNSHVTEQVYKEYLQINHSKVIPVCHPGIADHRKPKQFEKGKVRLTFIGNLDTYKGFPILKKELINLVNDGLTNWELNVWGGAVASDTDCDQIQYKGRYSEGDVALIFDETDLLIVPAVWKETFSFITLEALSFGVPVLVTESVGAKDIVKRYRPDFVIPVGDEALEHKLRAILRTDDDSLQQFNEAILASVFQYGMEEHLNSMNNLYK